MKEKIKAMWPDWEVVDNLGGGTFGQVFEIHRKIFSHTDKAALKIISIPKSKSDIQELLYNGYDQKSITERYKNHLEDIVKEYALMSDLRGCANVVYCDDVRYVQHPDGIGWDIYIKMELLKPFIMGLKNPVDEKQVIKVGTDICNVLVLCKEKNIIHRDIKPQNLFVSDDGTFKLGDFGIAKTAEKTMGGTKTGTYNYMAPEVYNNQPYGSASDQYSLGMVLYWMLNERRMPFFPLPPAIPTASQEEQARQRRMSGEVPPMPKNGSDALKAIVMKAIAPNPANRFRSAMEMRDALLGLNAGNSYEQTVNDSFEQSFAKPTEEPSVGPVFGGDAAFFDFAGEGSMGPGSLRLEDEEIPLAEGTVGNSWSFDEGSVGPDAGFQDMFNDFKMEGTIGVDNSPRKKADSERISPKEDTRKSGYSCSCEIERHPSHLEHLVKGANYKFYIDQGNSNVWLFNEPIIVCGQGHQFNMILNGVGKHTMKVTIHKPEDAKCKGTPTYTTPTFHFEIKDGWRTKIVANRPTENIPFRVNIIYEKLGEEETQNAKQTIKGEQILPNGKKIVTQQTPFGTVRTTVSEDGKSKDAGNAFGGIFGEFFQGATKTASVTMEVSPYEREHGIDRFIRVNIDGRFESVHVKIAKENSKTAASTRINGKGHKNSDGTYGWLIVNFKDNPNLNAKKYAPVVFEACNDNASPLALANGSPYLFLVDEGKQIYSVTAEKQDVKKVAAVTVGEPHTVELNVFSYKDPDCKGIIQYQKGPISFEAKEGYITRIRANRPSMTKRIKLEVTYEKQ